MRKPVVPSPFATGSTNRFVRSSFGGGVSASNSNTRVLLHGKAPASVPAARSTTSTTVNLGLNSERSRGMMIARLRKQGIQDRSEEHTSELQSLMRISYAVFCLKKKKTE